MREQDRHFLWSLYAAVAIIFLWKGIWDGIYLIPYLGDPFVFLFIGLALLTFTGVIFKEFDPLGGVEKATTKIINHVHHHPRKHEFMLKYQDRVQGKERMIPVTAIKGIEKRALVVEMKGSELFIPLQRITEIQHQGKTYWRA